MNQNNQTPASKAALLTATLDMLSDEEKSSDKRYNELCISNTNATFLLAGNHVPAETNSGELFVRRIFEQN